MERNVETETLETRNLNRRQVLGFIGATAAASLVGARGEQGSAGQMSAPVQNPKSRIVTVDAKPQRLAMDIAKTAVIVVDMQNDFGSKGGMFDHAGLDISMIQRAVGPTAKVLSLARQAGLKVVFLKMGFHPDLSDLGAADSPNRMRHLRLGVGEIVRAPGGTESRILIRDTWNTDIIPELKPQAGESVLYKHRFSGFYQTELDAVLKNLGIKYLIFTGCTTSVCVESTVRDAMFRDYSSLLLADCTGEPIGNGLPRSNHEASLLLIQTLFGWVSDSNEFIKALEAQSSAAA
jgi:ureidoacrylate peracid hydrolase